MGLFRYERKAFHSLKKSIASEPIWWLPDFNKPFEVYTSAFDYTIGGVLVNNDHLVALEKVESYGAKVFCTRKGNGGSTPLSLIMEGVSPRNKVYGQDR